MRLYKLKKKDNSVFITMKQHFSEDGIIDDEYISKCKKFADKKANNEETRHREHRNGGTLIRSTNQIYQDALEGKLAEYAIYDYMKKNGIILSEPDMEIYTKGKWDDSDFELDDLKISIKSTKKNGQLLLMEKKDFSEDGTYLPNKKSYDLYIVVRIDGNKYNIAGWIDLDDFKEIIRRQFVIEKGTKLNGHTIIDADNYYVQMKDMRDKIELIKFLKKKQEEKQEKYIGNTVKESVQNLQQCMGELNYDRYTLNKICEAILMNKDENNNISVYEAIRIIKNGGF